MNEVALIPAPPADDTADDAAGDAEDAAEDAPDEAADDAADDGDEPAALDGEPAALDGALAGAEPDVLGAALPDEPAPPLLAQADSTNPAATSAAVSTRLFQDNGTPFVAAGWAPMGSGGF